METDFPTASAGTSQAPSAAVEKSHSASHTEIRTLPDLRTERHPTTNRYDYSCTSDAESQSPACHHQSAWMLILRCPRCEYEHEDEFDVLNTDALGSMKCGACRSTFWFTVMECHRCAHEEAFEWPGTLS